MPTASEEEIDPIYEQLAQTVLNPRQRESLDRVKKAADYLVKSGIKVSPANVDRYCRERGWSGPKAQSIRNSSEVLFKYVKRRSAEQRFHKQTHQLDQPNIEDESIRAYVQLLVQQRDEARADRERIQAGLRTLPGISVDRLLSEGFQVSAEETEEHFIASRIQTSVRPALLVGINKIFDESNIDSCGLENYKDRIRQKSTKNILLEKEDVEAIRVLLRALTQGQ